MACTAWVEVGVVQFNKLKSTGSIVLPTTEAINTIKIISQHYIQTQVYKSK